MFLEDGRGLGRRGQCQERLGFRRMLRECQNPHRHTHLRSYISPVDDQDSVGEATGFHQVLAKGFAQSFAAAQTQGAMAARNVVRHDDPVTEIKLLNTRTQRDHLADALASHSDIGALLEDPTVELADASACWASLGLSGDEASIEGLLGQGTAQFAETAKALTG